MASYNEGKDFVVDWICDRVPQGGRVLDVGACDGKWADLISAKRPDIFLDACEIFKPNVASIMLKYDNIFVGDIYNYWYRPNYYDIVIFGDVIEHMTVERAQQVLHYARWNATDYVVGVPFEYPQGALYGNKWERHIQYDLTPELFAERYPHHELIIQPRDDYAYYHDAYGVPEGLKSAHSATNV